MPHETASVRRVTGFLHLKCHPRTPLLARINLSACVQVDRDRVNVDYRLEGDLTLCKIPHRGQIGRRDGLWKQTCFELFLKREGVEGYREFNFSPSREWAAYAFTAYRSGRTDMVLSRQPRVAVLLTHRVLRLRCSLQAHDIGLKDLVDRTGIALTAVVEARTGELSYWALQHGDGEPDFHAECGYKAGLTAA